MLSSAAILEAVYISMPGIIGMVWSREVKKKQKVKSEERIREFTKPVIEKEQDDLWIERRKGFDQR